MIDIDVKGNKEIVAFLRAFGSKGYNIINDELHKLAVDVRNDMIKSMRDTPRGNSKGIKSGYPSKPGFPPAIQSGNLINRIFIDKGHGYSRVFTDNVKYAVYLEKGTRRIEARPFFEPAVERSNWQRRILNRITAERFAGRRIGG